jgi:signal transduction histidine kinase
VSITATPVVLDTKPTGVIMVFHDITKEKEIDKAKTEFVSLASHQLRTPLSAVNWYVEMLLSGDAGTLNSEQKKYLDEVYKGNQRMVELVNSLLNVSRLELGTFLIEPKPTDVVLLAQSVADEQKLQIDQKKILFSFLFEKNIPVIQADPKLLRMVLQNLLVNAVKYTPEKGTIALSISLADKKDLLIKISDTGYGIPKHQQDKIFTKLFRADNVREKDTQGTGLGLYIVKSIMDHSGGKIWFESEENKGTTFFVRLPLVGMKKKEGVKTLA